MIVETEIVAALERVWAARPTHLHTIELFVSTSNAAHYRIDLTSRADGSGGEWCKHVYLDAGDTEELAARAGHVEGLARLGVALLEDMIAGAPKEHEHAAIERSDIPRDAVSWTPLYRIGDS